ncbi:LANO_0A05688g1_1 [Lachancea nothofagi CBS 11611]|uniref:LANO_0A05688g1_1 n=1 Tax=Lachancea nothofagi CBS 11611 TaxID=1266666 RepID=A0A1G4IRB2_9SACH|nr:LANO_0A05688g1_1 [Lachancea nothofagi CBS 11611]
MGLLSLFKGSGNVSKQDVAKIEKVVEVCDRECEDCAPAEDVAEMEKDEAKFSKLKVEQDASLFGSSKSSKLHFVVPTSQTDWEHDACYEKKGSVQHKIATWVEDNKSRFPQGEGENMSCNVSSLPIDMLDIEVMRGTKNDVLVLPHFLWIKSLEVGHVNSQLEVLVPLLLANQRDELLALDNIEEAKERSFVFLCSHKTRDKRCGITAPILQKIFWQQLKENGLYRDASDFRPDGCTVAFVNHVGGHKFAANVIMYLKPSHSLIWLGRVAPRHIPAIVELMIVPEKPQLPWPEKVRCVQKYSSW